MNTVFVSNLTPFAQGAWGGNPSIQVNGSQSEVLRKNWPAQDVLGRVAKNFQEAQNQTTLRDRVELRLSSVLETQNSVLENLPTGVLEVYASFMQIMKVQADSAWQAVTEYRDQLSAFDQTIQEYQDMLDGKTALPEQMSLEQVQAMLDLVKETRDTFLRKGAAEVNGYLSTTQDLADYDLTNKAVSAALGQSNPLSGKGTDFWRIDPNAQDIYGEIDRVLGAVEELSQTYGDSYSALNSELKRRDDSSYFYKYDRPAQNTQAGDRPKEYVLKDLLERTWWEFRDKSRDISNQLYRQNGQLTL